ncbi:hypothetical protein L915_11494, partial [Phytophthora nicotianae]
VSHFHQRLKQARLFNNIKRRHDEVDVRTKANPSPKELRKIAEMTKSRNPKLANRMVILQGTRNVPTVAARPTSGTET